MNKHLSKASGIWAKNVYIENEQKHYIFTEKSLERFAQDILDECMYLCVNVYVLSLSKSMFEHTPNGM